MIKKITWEEMQEMRGNTKFWIELFPKMDTDAFIKQANHYLANCSPAHPKNTSYDDTAINTVLPEALDRIKELEAKLVENENKVEKLKESLTEFDNDDNWLLESEYIDRSTKTGRTDFVYIGQWDPRVFAGYAIREDYLPNTQQKDRRKLSEFYNPKTEDMKRLIDIGKWADKNKSGIMGCLTFVKFYEDQFGDEDEEELEELKKEAREALNTMELDIKRLKTLGK